MTHYLIEIRLFGETKHYLRRLMQNVAHKFKVRGAVKKRAIPHITLVGPFYTNDEKRLVKEFRETCANYDLLNFRLNGFGHFNAGFFAKLMGKQKVVFVEIDEDPKVNELRQELVKKLQPFCTLNEFDNRKDRHLHATIAFKDIDAKFENIWKYIQSITPPDINQHLLRVAIIKDRKILFEYDFLIRRLLKREEAKDRSYGQFTQKLLSLRLQKLPDETWKKLSENTPVQGKVFFISDLHFDHENVIRFCDRPFRSAEKMNETMIKNWNNTVRKTDTVFILGDITYGRGHRPIEHWLKQLNGHIYVIKGNHDNDPITSAKILPDRSPFVYKKHKFILMHDPIRPADWDGWIIHGDKHNNNLLEFPLVNAKNKTINISAELVNYTPIEIDKLIELMNKKQTITTIDNAN